MATDLTPIIIGGAFSLGGVLIGGALAFFTNFVSNRQQIKREHLAHKLQKERDEETYLREIENAKKNASDIFI